MKTIISLLDKYIAFILVFLAPIKDAMYAVGALIVIDLIFGIIAARYSKEKITSAKLSKTIIKMLVYQLLIISAKLGESIAGYIPFLQITLSFIAITEIFSIGESFAKITGKSFVKYAKDIIFSKLKEKFPNDKPDGENK